MPRSSKKPGKSIAPSVQSISAQGIWLFSAGKEYFLPHRDFPWFKGAKLEDVLAVESPSLGHFYWPTIDVDLHVESLEQPQKYPIVFDKPPRPGSRPGKQRSNKLVAA
jgi:hypothetical protein